MPTNLNYRYVQKVPVMVSKKYHSMSKKYHQMSKKYWVSILEEYIKEPLNHSSQQKKVVNSEFFSLWARWWDTRGRVRSPGSRPSWARRQLFAYERKLRIKNHTVLIPFSWHMRIWPILTMHWRMTVAPRTDQEAAIYPRALLRKRSYP